MSDRFQKGPYNIGFIGTFATIAFVALALIGLACFADGADLGTLVFLNFLLVFWLLVIGLYIYFGMRCYAIAIASLQQENNRDILSALKTVTEALVQIRDINYTVMKRTKDEARDEN